MILSAIYLDDFLSILVVVFKMLLLGPRFGKNIGVIIFGLVILLLKLILILIKLNVSIILCL